MKNPAGFDRSRNKSGLCLRSHACRSDCLSAIKPKIEWLNPLALKVKDQSGLTEEELLDTFFTAKKKEKPSLSSR